VRSSSARSGPGPRSRDRGSRRSGLRGGAAPFGQSLSRCVFFAWTKIGKRHHLAACAVRQVDGRAASPERREGRHAAHPRHHVDPHTSALRVLAAEVHGVAAPQIPRFEMEARRSRGPGGRPARPGGVSGSRGSRGSRGRIAAKLGRAVQHAGLAAHEQGAHTLLSIEERTLCIGFGDQAILRAPGRPARAWALSSNLCRGVRRYQSAHSGPATSSARVTLKQYRAARAGQHLPPVRLPGAEVSHFPVAARRAVASRPGGAAMNPNAFIGPREGAERRGRRGRARRRPSRSGTRSFLGMPASSTSRPPSGSPTHQARLGPAAAPREGTSCTSRRAPLESTSSSSSATGRSFAARRRSWAPRPTSSRRGAALSRGDRRPARGDPAAEVALVRKLARIKLEN